MSTLTQEQCAFIFEMVQATARAHGLSEVEVRMGADNESLTRFANNTIHQNVSEHAHWLSIRSVIDSRTARASTNCLDRDGIESALEQVVALTRASESDPELMPLAEGARITSAKGLFDVTANVTPDQRAAVVKDAIEIVESAGHVAAGIFSTKESAEAIYNTSGLAAYHTETMARFSITATARDSSGWAKASSTDVRQLQPAMLAKTASDKASLSSNPRELIPGHYTVILEPAAVLDLVGQIFADFSATAIAGQRSFLTNRLGEALFGPNIRIYDDADHPLQAGPAFDGEGIPRKRLTLVDGGVPQQVAFSRASARKAGVEPTGHGLPLPNEIGEALMNIVIEGGNTSVDEMVASLEHGILVTRLWYIREVEPYEKIMTGMTRDGTFLIEDGQIVRGVRNFRFNQSVVELLRNVEEMSLAVRASGEDAFDMVVPAMKVHGFKFTEVTRF